MFNIQRLSLTTIILFILGTTILLAVASHKPLIVVVFFILLSVFLIFDLLNNKQAKTSIYKSAFLIGIVLFIAYVVILILLNRQVFLFTIYNLIYTGIFVFVIFTVNAFNKLFKLSRYKTAILLGIIILIVFIAVISAVAGRFKGQAVHDNILQVEAALEYLSDGKNPYTEDYVDTQLEQARYISTVTGQGFINPALYHNIKLPFHLLFSLPFYYLVSPFDQRYVYVVIFILSLLVLFKLSITTKSKLLLITLYSLNPLFLKFFINGRDDVFVLAWLLFSILLLHKKRFFWSALILGLALASKHTAWLILPFYIAYLYYLPEHLGYKLVQRINNVLKKIWPAIAVFLIFIIPFVIWDARSFWQDIILYPAGSIATSYPINGYNFANLAVSLGWIKSSFDYFPFWIPTLLIGLPLMWWLIQQQRKHNTLGTLMIAYGLFIFVFWFFSRFFHDNYIGYVSQILLIGYFLSQDQYSLSALNKYKY